MQTPQRTLSEWLGYLGWTQTELARRAHIDGKTAKAAIDGNASLRTKQAIAEAISRTVSYDVLVGDIVWS